MSEAPHTPERLLRELIESVLDGDPTLEERQALSSAIESCPSARKTYLEHCSLHAALAWEYGVLDGNEFRGQESPPPAKFRPSRGRVLLYKTLALAAALALVGAGLWQSIAPVLAERSWRASATVGSVNRYAGGELSVANTRLSLAAHALLRAGSYSLKEGLAALTLANEVTVLVEAPASFTIVSADLMILNEGKLSAHVPTDAVGFTVKTPDALVIDHGTEFGVEVTSNENSEVHVFEGEVEVKPLAFNSDSLRLFRDQATRVDRSSGLPSGIQMDSQRFMKTLEEPALSYSQEIKRSGLIANYRMSVSDDGVTLIDRSKNQRHGQIRRGATKATPFCSGRIGSALVLDGERSRSYAKVDQAVVARSGALTVLAWANATSRNRSATIASTAGPLGSGQFHLGLYKDQGGVEARFQDVTGATIALQDPTPLPIKSWHHIVLVVDPAMATLYRDGEIVDQAAHQGLFQPEKQSLTIGAKRDTPGSLPSNFWDGSLDEIAVLDRPLSHGEILSLNRGIRQNESRPLKDSLQ